MEAPRKLIINELYQQLTEAGIDLSLWGTGAAKTLEHLQAEVDSGESVLVVDQKGELLRRVSVADAVIKYTSPDGIIYYLKEEKQIFVDGRERRRSIKGISEKMMPDENPREAIVRGVREELGIDGELTVLEKGTIVDRSVSSSYPGLQSEYTHHSFEVALSTDQFRSDGYVEVQPDKSTYFVWES